MATGDIEVEIRELVVLNQSIVQDDSDGGDEIRMKIPLSRT